MNLIYTIHNDIEMETADIYIHFEDENQFKTHSHTQKEIEKSG